MTIDGYFDRGFVRTNSTDNAADAKAVGSNAGTTTIGIKGVEDLGGGLSVGFSVNTDWTDIGGISQDTDKATITTQTGGFANSQSYLEFVSKTAGKIQLGSINNELLTNATAIATPAFSTGIGSSYSSKFSGFNGVGTGVSNAGGIVSASAIGNTGTGTRGIRQANTIKYVSPNVQGFTFAYGYAPKNNTGTGDTVGVTDMSLKYENGPLTAMYSTLEYDTVTTDPANTQLATGVIGAGAKYKHSLLGASYQVLPTLKLHAGVGGTKSTNGGDVETSFSTYGVTYTMGKVDILAQVAKADDKDTTNNDRKMTGLGVNYNFSKTTRAYVRYDSLNLNTAAAASGSELKRTAVGISKSF